MELINKLAEIQKELKAPKDKVNTYSPSKFKYRNCEAILIALKPLLDGEVLLLNDEIVQVGDRFYVKATATIKDSKDEISVSAFARECITKKGMDDAQLTGSCSSYARKYALCGLFAIDDSADDPDSRDNRFVDIDLSVVAKECGYTDQEVCQTFTPALRSINDVQDKAACAEFLRNNKK